MIEGKESGEYKGFPIFLFFLLRVERGGLGVLSTTGLSTGDLIMFQSSVVTPSPVP